MKSKICLVLFVALALTAPLHAESGAPQILPAGDLPLTLSEVVNLMLDQNLDIRSNRMSPLSSRLQSLVLYRSLQPSLTFASTISRDTSASTTQLNGASSLSQLRHNFSAAFAQTLPTGTSLGVTLTMNRVSSNSSLNTYNPSYTGRLTYSLTQHLLRDFGREVNMRQIRQARNNEKLSDTQFEIQITSLLASAEKAYWDLVFAAEDLNVKRRSLELANQTLEENRLKVEIGTMAPIDIVQTRADVATRTESVIMARSTQTQAQDQIKKMISNQNDPSLFLISLRPSESPTQPTDADVPELATAIRIAIENRPELRQSALDLENREIDVQFARNQKLPVLDFTASYTQNGTGGVQTVRGSGFGNTQVIDIIPGGVFDAFGQIGQNKYRGYSFGATLTIPLKNRAAEADYSRALNERKLSNSKMEAMAQQIALEVRNALTQVEMNRARIETAKVSRELAVQKLEAERTKASLGTSTLRFVLEEQRNVAQAETNELQTVINLSKSMVDLNRAMGLTLQRNHVELDKAMQAKKAE